MEDNNIVSLFKKKISDAVRNSPEYNIETVINCLTDLESSGLLSQGQVSFLRQKYRRTWSTNREQLTNLVYDISLYGPRNTFIHRLLILRIPGIHDELRTYFFSPARGGNTVVTQHPEFIRKLLFNYKSQCDDNVFGSRKVTLQRVFDGFSRKVQEAETDEMKEKWLSAMTIIMSLLFQYGDDNVVEKMTDFTRQLPDNVNTSLPQLLNLSLRAITNARRNDWTTAEEYMDEAIATVEGYIDTTVRYLVQHHKIYLHQLKLQADNSHENRQQALQLCHNMLDMIVFDKQDDFSVLVYRSFCLYSVFILLGVGPFYEIDVNIQISMADIDNSKEMLERAETSFNDYLYPVEDRRRVVLLILKARLDQLHNRYVSALEKIEAAEQIMARGTPYQREKRNLRHFKEDIQNRTIDVNTDLPEPNLQGGN